jgi:hypothetical protein
MRLAHLLQHAGPIIRRLVHRFSLIYLCRATTIRHIVDLIYPSDDIESSIRWRYDGIAIIPCMLWTLSH